jgi:hypothetical protein
VGKTALVSQFMTSEYINTYDASLGKFVHPCTNTRGDGNPFGARSAPARDLFSERSDYPASAASGYAILHEASAS